MAVNNVGSTNTTNYSSTQKVKEFNSNLDKDSFLNLLVTQLQNQNPLQPMDDTQFISQMAQFSTLEQAQNTNSAIKLNSANNMVNKVIKASYKGEGDYMSRDLIGIVEKITVKNNDVYLSVDENGQKREVKFDDVKEVTELENTAEQSYLMNVNTKLAAANSMIGKSIKGQYYTTANDITTGHDIEGVVSGVVIKNYMVYLKVNDQNVRIEDVSEINEQPPESGQTT